MNKRATKVGIILLVLSATAVAGCATNPPGVENESEESPQADNSADSAIDDAIGAEEAKEPSEDEALLDRTQRTVYEIMDNTTRWFDGFFGQSESSEGEHVSRGTLRVSGLWDERDGFDPRFNLRASFALPALEDRARLILGRGDTEDIVDGTTNEAVESLPGSFDNNRDDDWLIGLGFNRSENMTHGLDFGIGVRITSPPDPYVNVTYRWSEAWDNSWSLRTRARAFWQNQRGTGLTLDSDLDHALSPTLMLRWANHLGVEDRVEGLGWRSDVIAYQGLSNNRGMAYGVFAQGETAAEVELQNLGFDIRYRQRLAREWFFIELAAGVSWPRFFLLERRKSNFGVGITFEMRFGRW